MQFTFFRFSRFFSFVTFVAALSTPALSMQPLITDDTGTQDSGNHQLEFSYNRDRTRIDKDTVNVHSVPLVYTYGVMESVDIYLGIEYGRIRSPEDRASGFGNTALGAKWRLFESEASGTSLGIKPEILFPVSSQRERHGLGTGKVSGSLMFLVSQELPFGSVHFNVGMGRDRYRNSDEDEGGNVTNRHVSIAPVWDVSEQWKLALDVGMDLARSDAGTVRSRYAEIGAVYAPNKDIELALGLIRTVDNDDPKSKTNSLTLGVTWRF